MNLELKYRILLLKSYLDTGIGLTNYFKYFIAFFGLYSVAEKIDIRITFLIAFFYGIFCFILGWAYFKYGWVEAQNEVSNRYNIFVKQMRKSIKRKA